MADSRYHKLLRVSTLITLFVLLFDGGFIAPITKDLSDNTVLYLANSVGIYAAVEPNGLNEITAELTARERELDEREIALRSFENGSANDHSTYILSTILFILTVLIVFNYAMDWSRVRRTRISLVENV